MDENRPLTIKQENFCQKYIETGVAFKAYKYAYDCERMKDGHIYGEASKLLKLPHIKKRIKELKEDLADQFSIDQQYIVGQYLKIIEDATEKGVDGKGTITDRGNWLKAVEKLAKTLGLEEADKLNLNGNLPLSINIIKPQKEDEEEEQESDEPDQQ